MRRLLFSLSLLLSMPLPASARDFCEELWFTRNLVFHRAGHCFASALGKALFGNDACFGTNVEPDPAEAGLVRRVQQLEAQAGCRVNTAAQSLDIPLLKLRKALVDLPLPSEFESACFGWRGGALALHKARDRGSPVIFMADTGDDLSFSFEGEGLWQFVEVLRAGRVVGAGWTSAPMDESSCTAWAG